MNPKRMQVNTCRISRLCVMGRFSITSTSKFLHETIMDVLMLVRLWQTNGGDATVKPLY